MLASASAMAQSKDDVRDTAAVDTAVWKSLELEGVVVKSHAVKVKVQGDSLVYNAAAYRVPEGSTLEALVKQLPGRNWRRAAACAIATTASTSTACSVSSTSSTSSAARTP